MHLVWLRIIDYTLSTNQINTSRRRGASAGWWCRSTQSRARGPLFHRRSARHEQGICQVRTSHLLRDGGGKVRLVVRALFLCAECGGARVCRSRSRGGRCPPPPRHRDGKMQRGRRRGCSPHILHRRLLSSPHRTTGWLSTKPTGATPRARALPTNIASTTPLFTSLTGMLPSTANGSANDFPVNANGKQVGRRLGRTEKHQCIA